MSFVVDENSSGWRETLRLNASNAIWCVLNKPNSLSTVSLLGLIAIQQGLYLGLSRAVYGVMPSTIYSILVVSCNDRMDVDYATTLRHALLQIIASYSMKCFPIAYIAIAQINKVTVGRFALHYGPWAKPTVAHFTGVFRGQHNDLISLLEFLLPCPEIKMSSITLLCSISMALGKFGSLRQFSS